MVADDRGEAERHGLGIRLHPGDQVLAGFQRRGGVDGEHHVVVEDRSDGREIGITHRALAHGVAGDERRSAHHQIMRIARVLAHVGVANLVAAARLVDDGDRRVDHLSADEGALDRARELVVGAPGRHGHDDLHVLLRRPALRLRCAGANQQNYDCDVQSYQKLLHIPSSFSAGRSRLSFLVLLVASSTQSLVTGPSENISPFVLLRPGNFRFQRLRRVQRPVRIVQHGAGHDHDVGLSVGKDLLGHVGTVDQAHRAGRDAPRGRGSPRRTAPGSRDARPSSGADRRRRWSSRSGRPCRRSSAPAPAGRCLPGPSRPSM